MLFNGCMVYYALYASIPRIPLQDAEFRSSRKAAYKQNPAVSLELNFFRVFADKSSEHYAAHNKSVHLQSFMQRGLGFPAAQAILDMTQSALTADPFPSHKLLA
jgi:hypothetical protein